MYKTNQKGGVLIIIIIGIIVVLLGVVVLSGKKSEENIEQDKNTVMENDDSHMDLDNDAMMEEKDGDAMMQSEAGKYVAYDPSFLENAETGKVVLFFHANWCPTCRLQDTAILNELENIPSDVTILKADYDSEVALKKKYGVQIQHTFVQVDSEGNQITKWSGGSDLSDIVARLK